jgi:hypothetical protein
VEIAFSPKKGGRVLRNDSKYLNVYRYYNIAELGLASTSLQIRNMKARTPQSSNLTGVA